MTKKDFKLIAEVLKRTNTMFSNFEDKSCSQYKFDLVAAFIEILKLNNKRFNSDKFKKYIYG